MVSVSYWKTFLNVNILIVAGKLSIVGIVHWKSRKAVGDSL